MLAVQVGCRFPRTPTHGNRRTRTVALPVTGSTANLCVSPAHPELLRGLAQQARRLFEPDPASISASEQSPRSTSKQCATLTTTRLRPAATYRRSQNGRQRSSVSAWRTR